MSVTADELYGIALSYGSNAIYFFPIIGGRGIWDAWVFVFSGLAICFFVAVLSITMHQRSKIREDSRARLTYTV